MTSLVEGDRAGAELRPLRDDVGLWGGASANQSRDACRRSFTADQVLAELAPRRPLRGHPSTGLRARNGAVALAEVFGLFSLAYGIASLILSFQVRDLEARRTATRHTPTPTSTKP